MDSCRSQRWIPRSIGGSCPPPRVELLEYLLDYLHEFIELLQFRGAECAQAVGEDFHAAPAAFEQNARAFVCCRNLRAALVLSGAPPYQFRTFKSGNDPAHGGRTYLFGGGQLADGTRASEYQHRESGELCGANAAGAVHNAEAAQQVDGGGMEAVGYRRGVRGRTKIALAFCHRI